MRVQEAQVANWFSSPLGQALSQAQADAVKSLLHARLYFHSAQIDAGAYQPLWRSERTGCGCMVTEQPHQALCASVLAQSHELPFANESLDLVILAHTLDFASDPYASLREVNRCLTASGTVVVVGFNPGIWQLARWYTPTRTLFSGARFLPRRRVCDWLNVLDFEVESSEVLFPSWPGNHFGGASDRIAAWLGKVVPFTHAAYVLVARKQSPAAIGQMGLRKAPIRTGMVTPSLTRTIGNT
ncbi:class I SAM-dependent methyltransferase [Salinibius halmophilus]|uniref:class I SAM-dependent methyltransferase n=1 Tax=Salinibius halmophilus TaxID=1853216 RepID=UPI000E66941F|nr:methyltransferase domain-containing protein [Salinibius halmophilus]